MKICGKLISTLLALLSAAAALDAQSNNEAAELLYVPGQYQNWNPLTAPALHPVQSKADKYEGYVNLEGAAPQYFKITTAQDWAHINYGDGGAGSLSIDSQASSLSVPEGGYYHFAVDLNAHTWSATKVTWGVIGSATPGGWERDTPMAYDPKKNVWEVVMHLTTNGSFKFRANGEWMLNFGMDERGRLTYANNPILGYNPLIKDLIVPENGTYIVTLDLSTPGNYSCSVQRIPRP
ncbi:MAG: hypothetical protein ABII82_16540 [Verrucomicrobiota bacterium]